jgi:hypothetical protein
MKLKPSECGFAPLTNVEIESDKTSTETARKACLKIFIVKQVYFRKKNFENYVKY